MTGNAQQKYNERVNMQPVLVTGATGRVGRAVIAELLGAGVPVRVPGSGRTWMLVVDRAYTRDRGLVATQKFVVSTANRADFCAGCSASRT